MPATAKKEIEIYIVMDSDGDYEVGRDQDEAQESYADNISDSYTGPRRVTCLKLRMTPPAVQMLSADIRDEPTGDPMIVNVEEIAERR